MEGNQKHRIGNQEAFDEYMRKLEMEEKCRFMVSFGIPFCTDTRFSCPYRGKEMFTLRTGKKPECSRDRVNELKKMLGSGKKAPPI